jgi:hypothetical protein
MFHNLEGANSIITREKDPNNREKLVQFVNLRDQHGLSILGYILLLGKSDGIHNLYSYVKHDKGMQDIISSSLNTDITSVLDYYSLQSKIINLIDYIKRIKKYVPSFQLSEENAKLIGYRMAKDAFKPEFELRDIRMFPRFTIPDSYAPFVPYVTQPPPGPPSLPPPPPLPYPHLPSYPQQYPPPFSRNGGTRKNHKRHKKQMRKHASKKSKHA